MNNSQKFDAAILFDIAFNENLSIEHLSSSFNLEITAVCCLALTNAPITSENLFKETTKLQEAFNQVITSEEASKYIQNNYPDVTDDAVKNGLVWYALTGGMLKAYYALAVYGQSFYDEKLKTVSEIITSSPNILDGTTPNTPSDSKTVVEALGIKRFGTGSPVNAFWIDKFGGGHDKANTN